ncbi:hypothetical protein [Arthrobacter sp. VKM Ac-2550]|uniref:hypothetical protein n=1 Tax=Crystallibacter permensis TaxID=1938888 RepID=UPI002225ED09|nr:hypothetical protein [Arthrobacter sp. VKM Ac-2550]MCW2132890.1 hypothetical protein [Arthrobacter sp. VKM Ac-2550]
MAIDFDYPLGKVRLLTADLDEATPVLSDDIIDGYLSLNDGNIYRAAADALDAVATTETLLSKKITSQDLSTDGPAVAKELRAKAASLRAKADADDAAAETGFFDIIPFGFVPGPEGAEMRYP